MGLLTNQSIPRPLASHGQAAGRSDATQGQVKASEAIVLPAKATRIGDDWLVDSYFATGRTHVSYRNGEMRTFDHYGFLLLAAEHTGLFAHAFRDMADTSEMIVGVEFVTSAFATPDGRVSVSVPGAAYNGWFTEGGGLALVATDSRRSGEILARHDTLVAEGATAPDLHLPTGLYAVTWQSEARIKGERKAEEVTWTGMAAVAIARDSIWVDLKVVAGDLSRQVALMGPVSDGKFQLRSKEGDLTLGGSVYAGQLTATLLDRRTRDVRLEGRLRGQRR